MSCEYALKRVPPLIHRLGRRSDRKAIPLAEGSTWRCLPPPAGSSRPALTTGYRRRPRRESSKAVGGVSAGSSVVRGVGGAGGLRRSAVARSAAARRACAAASSSSWQIGAGLRVVGRVTSPPASMSRKSRLRAGWMSGSGLSARRPGSNVWTSMPPVAAWSMVRASAGQYGLLLSPAWMDSASAAHRCSGGAGALGVRR